MRVEVGKDLITYGTIATSGTGLIYSGNSDLLKTIVKEARVITGPAVSDEKMLSLFPMLYRNRQWARIVPDQKFNPYHDALGMFTSGDGLGMANPGQGELPGMPIGLNPGAFRQPQLFGKPSQGAFTSPIVVMHPGANYPEMIPVDKLATAELTRLGGALAGGDNPRFKAEVDGVNYFVKALESNLLGKDAQDMVENETGARDAAKVVGLENQTVPVDTFIKQGENAWGQSYDMGTYLAQPFIDRQSGVEMAISLYDNGDYGYSNRWEVGDDISIASECLSKIDTPTLSTMIAYEYAMGTGDRHEGQYLFDANAPANQTIILNDFDAGFNYGTDQEASWLANMSNYAGRELNIYNIKSVADQAGAIEKAFQARGLPQDKIDFVMSRLEQLAMIARTSDTNTITLDQFQEGVSQGI